VKHVIPNRPKLLLITRNLPPLIGGMERLIWHIADELRQDFEVHIIGPRGCSRHLPEDVRADEIPTQPLWRFLASGLSLTLRRSRGLRPDLVLAGSGLTAPLAWLGAKLCGARCMAYLHGLDVEARHPVYRLLWHPFLRRCDHLLVNSRFTHSLATGIGIPAENISLVHPGVALPGHTESDADALRRSFRKRHALGEYPVMLYVGRITARKGLLPFVQQIMPRVLDKIPEARLLIVGDEPSQALVHRDGLKSSILRHAEEARMSHHLVWLGWLGRANEQELEAAYFASDLLVFPVQPIAGDHEGFGMVAIEAAAHGLPTVAFDAGGVGDAVSDPVSGRLVPAGDNTAFADAVLSLLEGDGSSISTSCRAFAAEFEWAAFGNRIRKLCRNVLADAKAARPGGNHPA
jgi:phosphatidylinositol alpha-1,6-mannosyltransferase